MDTYKTKEGCSEDKNCDYNNFKRARYFHGMLLTDRDFREEQVYHDEKRKLLNRMLHGWGVVCGLGIKETNPKSSKVIITPGMALDCHGNEILVCEDFELDLKKETCICPDTSKDKDPCADKDRDDKECKYYVAIKYNEVPTDPVPVYSPSAGCEDKVCEYSRTREGFCVKLLKTIPCHAVTPKNVLFEKVSDCSKEPSDKRIDCVKNALEAFHHSFCEEPYPCPACCCCDGEAYVVLGSIDLKKTNCRVTTVGQDMIDINDGRRYVITAMFWQYYLGSFFPPIAEFLENPFVIICELLDSIVERLRRLPEEAGASPRVDAFRRMTEVKGMTEAEAKTVLRKHDVAYNRTISLSSANAFNVAGRAMSVEKIEPKMKVDLVTDRAGKVLFYVPAEEVPDTAELQNRIKEVEKTVRDEFQTRIQEREKAVREELSAQLKESEKARVELQSRFDETVKKLESRITKLEKK
ncbi:MAG TPA: hypothetical protein VNN20_11815 [Thermodesulfobacteriota bacterium]|nr:hypothetical protein [Thermodesulfobacteriota bacterium]